MARRIFGGQYPQFVLSSVVGRVCVCRGIGREERGQVLYLDSAEKPLYQRLGLALCLERDGGLG